jgi:uncharacterized damage-inducible protein DinB
MSQPIAKWNCTALNEHLQLLEKISDEAFAYTRAPVFPSPLGSHLRHDLDHYLSFLRGVPEGKINYEDRVRDPELETSRTRALEVIRSIMQGLEDLTEEPRTPLEVRVEDGDTEEVTLSNLRRELDFLLSHTIHHQAIIAMMVRDLGETPSPTYGMAPSTLRHYRQVSCAQ